VVIESRLDKGRGPVATVLVQNGTLRKGDIVLAGQQYGRVRAMINELGSRSTRRPVDTGGGARACRHPDAGDEASWWWPTRSKAREVAKFRQGKYREVRWPASRRPSWRTCSSQMGAGEVAKLNVVLKADVQGSWRRSRTRWTKLSTDEVQVNVVSSGGRHHRDRRQPGAGLRRHRHRLQRACRRRRTARSSSGGPRPALLQRHLRVIDEVKQAMSGMLARSGSEEIVGVPRSATSSARPLRRRRRLHGAARASCKTNKKIRVLRDNVVIYEGELESLRRFKDDVQEVRNGTECGIGVKNYNDVKVGDQIEVFERVQVERHALRRLMADAKPVMGQSAPGWRSASSASSRRCLREVNDPRGWAWSPFRESR
jgi:translation initiation factor IF-2